MTVSQIRRTAVHEAGHSVFAVITETRVRRAVIGPTGAGHLLEEPDDDEGRLLTVNDAICDIVVVLAGEMAERSLLGDCDDAGLTQDFERVAEALADIAAAADHQQTIHQRCRSAVESLFQMAAIRGAVERVADALERQRELTADEIAALVPEEARRAYRHLPDIDLTR